MRREDEVTTVCVLAKYPDVFAGFMETSTAFTDQVPKILVRDGHEIPDKWFAGRSDWRVIQGPEKFSMAGNGNLALRAGAEAGDVLYCGDDIRFIEYLTVERLREVAYRDPHVGILSPRLVGRGTPEQKNPPSELFEVTPDHLWFPCVYIKHEVFESIGFLDESFSDFGKDDLDFNIRARLSGFTLAVTNVVSVVHDAGECGGPTTFERKLGLEEVQRQIRAAEEHMAQKYGKGWVDLR